MRKPSDATALRTVRRELTARIAEVNQFKVELNEYRRRTNKAEGDASEWKKRFDLLLARPVQQPTTMRLSADDLHDLAPNR